MNKGTVTAGQADLAMTYANELADAIYAMTVQTEGSEARNANIEKARKATARVAELLGAPEVAEEIRKAA